MTVQAESQPQETKPSDKEMNFRALEAKYQRQLEQERKAREQAEKEAQELRQRTVQKVEEDDEDEDDEPYVDKRKLNKKLNRFGNEFKQQTKNDIKQSMEWAKQQAKEELKQELWMEQNPDYEDVLQKHAEEFWNKHKPLAETILRMPEGFERNKLVYHNIKSLGLDKPAPKQSPIQETIDARKKGPYYQPTGVGAHPYTSQADYSRGGQEQAYKKMQELKNKLRLG